MDDELYLDAAEAAQILGVSVTTLYAYVSRKKLRSFPIPGSRARRYWRSDIVGLTSGVQRTGVSPSAPRDSAITLLTDNGTYYRGRSVIGLAEDASVEEVAALLWQAEPTLIFSERLPKRPVGYAALVEALATTPAHDRALSLLPLIEHANPLSFDLSAEGFSRTAADTIRSLAAILVNQAEPSADPLHSFIGRSCGVSPAISDAIRCALILAADHEFDPTTNAVRAAATGVTPYAAVLVGLISGRGQKLRIRRTEAAARLVREITASSRPEDVVIALFRSGETILGFGGVGIHEGSDPRADALLRAFEPAFVGDPEYDRFCRAMDVARELTMREPAFMLPLIFLGQKLGLAGNELGVGTIGRAIGWIAHAQEQQLQPDVERPRASYIGPLPL